MGVINSSTTGIDGVKHLTVVRTNRLEDFVIETVARLGLDEWRVVHFIEKRKLKRKA